MKTIAQLALLVAGGQLLAYADSVTTTDNLTLFGRVQQLDRTEVKPTARFPSQKGIETKEVDIPRSKVVKIEFNATTFNPGAPPPGLRSGGASAAPPAAAGEDAVVLRGGQAQKCDEAIIEAQKVRCAKQEWDRNLVIRILVGRR